MEVQGQLKREYQRSSCKLMVVAIQMKQELRQKPQKRKNHSLLQKIVAHERPSLINNFSSFKLNRFIKINSNGDYIITRNICSFN